MLALIGCGDSLRSDPGPASGSIVVKAPAAGQVSRLLVSEGVKVNAGAPIIELIPDTTGVPAAAPSNNAETQAVNDLQAADREVETARAEVIRNEANVQRLAPLVASGQASQAELDGANAQYEQAQKRLQQTQDAAQKARGGLDRARQPEANQIAPPPSSDSKIVTIRAPSAGTLTVIGASVGDRVIAGQSLATIRGD